MNIAEGFRWLIGRESPPVQERSGDSVADLVARMGLTRTNPWRRASTRDAMGVPAVFKAVSLIANTIGTLSMEGYRNTEKMLAIDTPRLIVRPDPFTTPYAFWQTSAYYKARRGETWWWIAKRDSDGLAMSILAIDPREIVVERNSANALRPIITWLGKRMPNDDMVQMKYLPDPNNALRGIGPLQACGAAVSVAVEAQEYAANFFAGSPTNTIIKHAGFLGEGEDGVNEALTLKTAWMTGAGNTPKVIDQNIESVTDIGSDPAKAQLAESRLFQNGEVALMFSMPPTLLNYAVQGSTITYQNVGQVADDLARQCLLPHYLEPMEQAMSDLLPRSTVGRFNVKGLLRPDIKTRFDVHAIAIANGIYDAQTAASEEGYEPGDVENRPVPFAAPQAVPTSLPVQQRSALHDLRCPACGRLAGRVSGAAEIKCRSCNTIAVA